MSADKVEILALVFWFGVPIVLCFLLRCTIDANYHEGKNRTNYRRLVKEWRDSEMCI